MNKNRILDDVVSIQNEDALNVYLNNLASEVLQKFPYKVSSVDLSDRAYLSNSQFIRDFGLSGVEAIDILGDSLYFHGDFSLKVCPDDEEVIARVMVFFKDQGEIGSYISGVSVRFYYNFETGSWDEPEWLF